MYSIHPYLIFDGNCREAMNYYAEAFGGKIIFMRTFAEAPAEVQENFKIQEEVNSRIFDSKLEINDVTIRASDNIPGNNVNTGSNFSLFTTFSSVNELENVYSHLSKDGQVWMLLSDSPTGKFGMVMDKYGYSWMLNWSK